MAERRTRKTVRIKKGVRPYGGRRLILVERHTYPNGREVVWLRLRTDGYMQGLREYNAWEVEDEREETVDV